MKKIIASVLSLSLALALASCGGETAEPSDVSSTVSIPPIVSSNITGVSSVDVPSEPPAPVKVDLALEATAVCDENTNHFDNEFEYAASCVNDQDITTAWQKDGSLTVNNPTDSAWIKDEVYDEETEIFIGLEWTDAQYIDTVVIYNDIGNPMETPENGGYKLEYFDGENYVEVTNLTDTRVSAGFMEITINFDAVSTTKIKLSLYKGVASGKNSPKIYTMCVYEAEEPAEEVTSEAESTEEVVSE